MNPQMTQMDADGGKLDEETYAVIGAAMAVHAELGHGFLEPVLEGVRPEESALAQLRYAAPGIQTPGTALSTDDADGRRWENLKWRHILICAHLRHLRIVPAVPSGEVVLCGPDHGSRDRQNRCTHVLREFPLREQYILTR